MLAVPPTLVDVPRPIKVRNAHGVRNVLRVLSDCVDENRQLYLSMQYKTRHHDQLSLGTGDKMRASALARKLHELFGAANILRHVLLESDKPYDMQEPLTTARALLDLFSRRTAVSVAGTLTVSQPPPRRVRGPRKKEDDDKKEDAPREERHLYSAEAFAKFLQPQTRVPADHPLAARLDAVKGHIITYLAMTDMEQSRAYDEQFAERSVEDMKKSGIVILHVTGWRNESTRSHGAPQ